MKNKKAKFRIEGAALTALVIVAVILINVFFTALSEKINLKIDLTEEGAFSLTEETKAVIAAVNREVKIYYATNAQMRDESYQEILECFANESPLITVSEVNIDTNPGFVDAHKITDYNTVVVESIDGEGKVRKRNIGKEFHGYEANENGVQKRKTSYLEGHVAAAVKYVTSDDPLNVLIAYGHGEMVEVSECFDYITEMLLKEGMDVGFIDFATDEIAEGTDMILFIGPSMDFTDSEIKKLDDYFERGGRVQFYSNPIYKLENINDYFEKNWGVRINNDYVSDENSGYVSSTPGKNYLVPILNTHSMTEYFVNKGFKVRMSEGLCNSLDIMENEAIEANVLVSTSGSGISMDSEAWEKKTAREKYEIDKIDELKLCVYLRQNTLFNNETTARLLVAGSYDIILDEYFDPSSGYANKDVAIKSINYMSGIEDAPVSVSGKNIIKEEMKDLTNLQFTLIIAGLAGLIPVIMFVIGIVVYVRRHRL